MIRLGMFVQAKFHGQQTQVRGVVPGLGNPAPSRPRLGVRAEGRKQHSAASRCAAGR